MTAHAGRRTFVSSALNAGCDSQTVAKASHHKDINTVNTYYEADKASSIMPTLAVACGQVPDTPIGIVDNSLINNNNNNNNSNVSFATFMQFHNNNTVNPDLNDIELDYAEFIEYKKQKCNNSDDNYKFRNNNTNGGGSGISFYFNCK